MSFDLIIKNGTVATAVDTYKADLGIKDGIITAVCWNLEAESAEVIDANRGYIIPGGIDPHTHFSMPFRDIAITSDDFETGTRAAAFGGTTCIIDCARQERGKSFLDSLDALHKKAEGNACIDYGFHVSIVDLENGKSEEISRLVEEGVSSFELSKNTPGGQHLNDGAYFQAMRQAADNGCVVCTPVENGYITDELHNLAVKNQKLEPKWHAICRAESMEAGAVHRAITISELAGAPVYIVHLSCAEALAEVTRARNKGLDVFAETCPQYLFLDNSCFEQGAGWASKFVMSPPLREKRHQEKLWKGLQVGNISVVGSNHTAFNYRDVKEKSCNDFTKIPEGVPSVENRMSLLYSGGVAGRKITLNRFVDITSTAASKIFGLFPRKGTIAVGSDADIVIFNPTRREKISVSNPATHHMNVDYNAFEEIEVMGMPEIVISRGKVIVKGNNFLGQKGDGKFVRRGRYSGVKCNKYLPF
ncbi:dihydropyrimidinase [Candidatus Riflebacteria bacterium]